MKILAGFSGLASVFMVFLLAGCGCDGEGCCPSCSGCSHACHRHVEPNCLETHIEATSVASHELTEEEKMAREKAASGLEWEVLKEGTGISPEKGKAVTVHYTGWLSENGELGKKFDSSVDRGQKFSFRIGLGMVIPGWDEGVMSMKVGEKRRLFIPSNLAYGAQGAGGVIPPNADLIFDVELFEVA